VKVGKKKYFLDLKIPFIYNFQTLWGKYISRLWREEE
jgi:hypothetical protein